MLDSGETTLIFAEAAVGPSFDELRLMGMRGALNGPDAQEMDGKRWLDTQPLKIAWGLEERQVRRVLDALIERGRVEKATRPGKKSLYRLR